MARSPKTAGRALIVPLRPALKGGHETRTVDQAAMPLLLNHKLRFNGANESETALRADRPTSPTKTYGRQRRGVPAPDLDGTLRQSQANRQTRKTTSADQEQHSPSAKKAANV